MTTETENKIESTVPAATPSTSTNSEWYQQVHLDDAKFNQLIKAKVERVREYQRAYQAIDEKIAKVKQLITVNSIAN